MEGLDGSPLRPLFKKWNKFKTERLECFELKEGAMLAKIEMDKLQYKRDISDYTNKIRSLNYQVEMKGVALRALIQTAIPPEVHVQLLYAPSTNNVDDWMDLVVRICQTLELSKRQEKLFEVKQVTSKKGTKTTKNWEDPEKGKKWGTTTTSKSKAPDTFPRPKNYQRLTDEEKAQREIRLKGVSETLQDKRKEKKQCIRCGQTGHGQYTCPAPRPVVLAIKQQPSNKRKLKEEDKDEEETPTKKPTLSTS